MTAIGGLFETVFHTCVRGYHVYQDVWVPTMDEMLTCCREVGNPHDPFAVKVIKVGETVGHLPKKISSTCSLFILNGGSISCKVTDPHRRYSSDLVQGGLEIPCIIILQGTKELIDKARKLLAISGEIIVSANEKPIVAKKRTDSDSSAANPVVTDAEPDTKRIKLESEPDQRVWLTFTGTRIQLFVEDKCIIVGQQRLNDRHINFAQALLRAQFPSSDGLQNTLLQGRLRLSVSGKIVQILHIRSNHWVVISNVQSHGNNMSVYDTVYNDIDSSTQELFNSMFEEDVTFSIVKEMEKQQGDIDCGAFSIAIATSLLHGLTPLQYNQPLLRDHLIECLEAKCFQPFP